MSYHISALVASGGVDSMRAPDPGDCRAGAPPATPAMSVRQTKRLLYSGIAKKTALSSNSRSSAFSASFMS